MQPLRPLAKTAIVLLGLVVAFAIACAAVVLQQRLTQGSDAQASAGMYAFGDLVLAIAVFGVVALIPLALALYWLRPVAWFWSALVSGALLFSLTGFAAVAANYWITSSNSDWMFLAHARVGIMPLNALGLLLCAAFAPRPRHRWMLLAVAITEGALLAGLFLVLWS